MALPLVSICIPIYNQRADLLRACVASALAQTYANIEIVISNNHSTNDVPVVLGEFTDPRIRVISPPHHLPLTEHFAFVAAQAHGEYLSFLPSDDWVYPDWLTRMLPLFAAHPTAVLGLGEIEGVGSEDTTKVRFTNRDNAYPTGFRTASSFLADYVHFDRRSGWIPGGLIRAAAYWQAGGIARDGLRITSDLGLVLRLLELGDVVYVGAPVGRNTTWESRQGKVESIRMAVGIDDLLKLDAIICGSATLTALLREARYDLGRVRQSLGLNAATTLLRGLAKGKISQEEARALRKRILRVDHSWKTRLILARATVALWRMARTVTNALLPLRLKMRVVELLGG